MPFHWLLGMLATLALGGAASAWLWLERRRRDEAAAGLAALAAMRWREFSRFVLDAMRHRGYEVEADPVALAGARQTDFVLHRDGKRALLACRHGADATVDARTVHGLENALLANGAATGVLVTTGIVEPGALRTVRASSKLELSRGGRLWRELKPLLPESLRDEAESSAARQARGRMRLAWLGALALGVVVALVGGRAYAPADPAGAAAPPLVGAPAPTPATPAPAAGPVPVAPVPAADPAEEAIQRTQVALDVSALPGIADATWVTDSTLLVDLRSDANERLPEICAILEQYEALRASRLQLNPPPGSNQPVRFRQCRAF